jgi:hypothetical protein
VKLIAQELMPKLREVELYLHSPICLHGIVLNYMIKYRDHFTFIHYSLSSYYPTRYNLHNADVVKQSTERKRNVMWLAFVLAVSYLQIPLHQSLIIISTPRCPDRLWGSPNLLSNG